MLHHYLLLFINLVRYDTISTSYKVRKYKFQHFDLPTDSRRLRQQCIAPKCQSVSRRGLECAELYLHMRSVLFWEWCPFLLALLDPLRWGRYFVPKRR